ncbi:hypothetical protein [uncultured Desulfovibrio sp.]|uniref:hypothetical protein n=1 Tax=uncultured Desulfovibrio sp. TaxID=167968 RepID=UPI00345B6BAC
MSHYRQGGVESLAGRSSRPGRCRDTFTGENACRMLALWKMRMTGDETALRPGFCCGGVFRALRKPGCSRRASLGGANACCPLSLGNAGTNAASGYHAAWKN